jgi:hypothetical protein
MDTARKIYSEQSRGHTFKDEQAWRILRNAPKWKQDNNNSNHHTKRLHFVPAAKDLSVHHQSPQPVTTCIPINHQHSHLKEKLTSPEQPLKQQPSLPKSSITPKRDHSPHSSSESSLLNQSIQLDHISKRARLDQDLERLIHQTPGASSTQTIPVIPTQQPEESNTNTHHGSIQNNANGLTSVVQVHDRDALVKQNLLLEAELKRSQIELNHMNLLMQSEADCPDHDTLRILRLMKDRLKKRLLPAP